MDAFKNDDSLAPVQNAGISGKGPMAVDCKINGKVIKGVVANQRVRDVAAAARVKINYSCEQGSCKTCRIKMNGKQVLACQSKITPKKCDIRV
jgi:ferredoxin